ncbi:inositol 1,4,5-triphosphate receptor associated 2-like isoform X1 [Hydractinia symbiolongicarpus]|uniref:inositol 1,4,5-triphosphate receptor associated 2-like isoform X1 n=1 Tax=Hydractinia symbiolongicarpus TaxID=13093 RepID=UPI002550DCE0|nr:inositol 1,4,5-triphosphate receptor associated 2-like isoform X1 [Hydractinia symbiolongicarpus]
MEPVTEEGLKPEISIVLQNVFTACDEEKHGQVRVSKLISFLKEKATETEIFDYLNDLSLLLDEERTDPAINWSACEKGMQEWIQIVNQKSIKHINSGSPAKRVLFPKNELTSAKSALINKSLQLKDGKTGSIMSTYSNDSMETSDLSWDHSDLHGRIEELEITNKRLLEDNVKLKQHLDATEDQNSSFVQENDQLQKKIIKYEKLLDDSKLVAKNYEELKATVMEYHVFKNDLVEKTCQLEKENTSLQAALKEYEDKVSLLDSKLDLLKEEKENLTRDLSIQKQLQTQIQDLTSSKEHIVEESANKSEYMSSMIADLSLANEVLKAQKNNIENELSELKQEVCRNAMLNRFSGIHSTPLLSSTKCDKWPQSLDQELKEGLENSLDNHIQPIHDFSDGSDSSSQVKNSPIRDRYTSFAQKCRSKFKEKKELIFDKIEEIVMNPNTSANVENTSLIFDDLNKDFESFTEKISELAQEKQEAEKRALKLSSALRKLKDDNQFLQDSKDKALLKFGNLSISSMELEEKKSELIEELAEKENTVKELKTQIDHLKKQLAEEKKNTKEQITYCTKSTQTLENKQTSQGTQTSDSAQVLKSVSPARSMSEQQQIQDLKRLVTSLESRNLEFSRKVFDMEDMLMGKDDVMEQLKQDLYTTQNVLSTLKQKYESELSHIFQIIPKNVPSHTMKQSITYQDITDQLFLFMKQSEYEHKKLMGVRESPEGGPRSSDATQTDNYSTDFKTTQNLYEESVRTKPRSDCSVQTELDMFTMDKILEAYELIPTSVEPVIPERLRRHNSIELKGEDTIDASVVNQHAPAHSPVIGNEMEGVWKYGNNENVNFHHANALKNIEEESSVFSQKENGEINNKEERKFSSETVISSRSTLPPVILTQDENEQVGELLTVHNSNNNNNNIELNNEDHNSLLPKNVVNLKIANIIEFDRSDISSDSEPEGCFKNRRRKRISLSKRGKVSNESEQSPVEEVVTDENNNTLRHKQRRLGVSAEPVRVSWSRLRETFKQQQIENFEYEEDEKKEETSEHVDECTDEVRQDADLKVEEDTQLHSSDIFDTENASTPSVPVIEVVEDQDDNHSTCSEDVPIVTTENLTDPLATGMESDVHIQTCKEEDETKEEKENDSNEAIKKLSSCSINSLQVPAVVYKKKNNLSKQERVVMPSSYVDMKDEDMEKKFNNLVLSFQTDQFTLQKRMDNQERARDVAEASMDKEIANFSSKIKDFRRLQIGTQEFEEAYVFLQRQAEILRKAAMKISAQSEQHGCYQQEFRAVPNMELMIAYTEILKLNMTRMADELNECRRRLQFGSDRSDLSDFECSKPTDEGESNVENNDEETLGGEKKSFGKTRKNTLSGISRTLMLAQGMSSKVRKRRKEALNLQPLITKRVSFGETIVTDDVDSPRAPIIECSSDPAGATLQQIKSIGFKLLLCFFAFIFFYFFLFTINTLEIDTLKLHDKLLQYIPHSIEYQTNSEEDR